MNKFLAPAAVAMSVFIAMPAQASFDDQFRCDPVGDGEHLVILSSRDQNKAQVQYSITGENAEGAPDVSLTQLSAVYNYPESGARYTGGEYMLLLTNSNAVLLFGIGTENEGHTECRFVGEEVPEDAQPLDPADANDPPESNQ